MEIKEAVEYFNNWDNPDYVKTVYNTRKHLSTLVDLAQSYLNLKGFPDEKEVLGEKEEVFTADDMNNACNEVLKECKLAVMKMYSKERILEKLEMHNASLLFSSCVWNYPQDSDKIIDWLNRNNKNTAQAISNIGKC